jgi:hypothetical protein
MVLPTRKKTFASLLIRYDGQAATGEAKPNAGQKEKVLLDENDELWTEIRHQHIANVTKFVN